MKKIIYLLLLLTPLFFSSCEDEVLGTKDLNYITFEKTTFDFGVDIGGSNEYEIKVFTTQITSTDRTFNIDVVSGSAESAAYNIPATVTVPANTNIGVLTVTLNDVNIGDAGKNLVLEIAAQEGLFKGPSTTINITQVCPFNEVILTILFDGYASETTWELLDSSGNVLYSGGGYQDGLTQTSAKFCLQDGTYTFNIYDDYGDGLSYPSDGSATLSKGTEVLAEVVGDFGDSATRTFSVSK